MGTRPHTAKAYAYQFQVDMPTVRGGQYEGPRPFSSGVNGRGLAYKITVRLAAEAAVELAAEAIASRVAEAQTFEAGLESIARNQGAPYPKWTLNSLKRRCAPRAGID